jgi:hypothetical protein
MCLSRNRRARLLIALFNAAKRARPSTALNGNRKRIAPLQNAVLAAQNDILCIVVLQIAVDIASLAPLEMIFEDLNRRTDSLLRCASDLLRGCIN